MTIYVKRKRAHTRESHGPAILAWREYLSLEEVSFGPFSFGSVTNFSPKIMDENSELIKRFAICAIRLAKRVVDQTLEVNSLLILGLVS